jgi:hypothetical protein
MNETLLCKKTRYDGKRLIIKKTLAGRGLSSMAAIEASDLAAMWVIPYHCSLCSGG